MIFLEKKWELEKIIFVPFVETRRNLFFIYFGRVVRRLIFWQGFHEIVGRKPRKNWPKGAHPIQHKSIILLLPCCQILHMDLQNKGSTPKNRNTS